MTMNSVNPKERVAVHNSAFNGALNGSQNLPTNYTIPLTLLTMIAIAGLFYIAAPIMVPVAFAIYLNIVLSPVVLFLEKNSVPKIISSCGLVALIILLPLIAIIQLGDPAEHWLQKAPRTLAGLERKVLSVTTPLSDIQKLSEQVEDIAELPAGPKKEENITVKVEEPTIIKRFADSLPTILTRFAILIFLTFFLLSAGDSFLRKSVRLWGNLQRRKRYVRICRNIQASTSGYLAAISVINIFLGILVALAMWMLKAPNPILWGVLAMVLNFIPYIGPALMMGILMLVGILNYEDFWQALHLPLAFIALNILESQVVSPLVIGQRLSLSPAIVFLSVIFWSWLWGIPGAFLAVPITVSIKVVAEQLPVLHPFSQLMEG